MTDPHGPEERETIYDDLDVPRVINAAGTRTRVGGTRMPPTVVEAMSQAARSFARISDLQARASEAIASATGAQAGYVVSGAAAGLTMATAACMAGLDPAAMDRLPTPDGLPNEVIVPLVHRNSYDRMVRSAGAALRPVGTNDRQLGAGASALEPWEVRSAITEHTAALLLVPRDELSLEPVIEVARSEGVPVIVDAAGTVPPRRHLSRFIDLGADLVVFSGGKGIRGPQSTGIVAGRRDLIASIAAQHLDMDTMGSTWSPPAELLEPTSFEGVPRHGLGRGFKVGKEEIVGLITALELFVQHSDDDDFGRWDERARRIGTALMEAGFDVSYPGSETTETVTQVTVEIRPDHLGLTAGELVRALHSETPRIVVGDRDIDAGRITIDPRSLTAAETTYLTDRLRERMVEG